MDERDAYEVLQVHPKANEVVIRAAYRALAALYHPDRDTSTAAPRRMAEVNAAYEQLRTADRRKLYDRMRSQQAAATPSPIIPPQQPSTPPPPRATDADGGALDFGRYSGWTIKQLARQDPDYLRWLSRHSSGIRFRREIETALRDSGPVAQPSSRSRGR